MGEVYKLIVFSIIIGLLVSIWISLLSISSDIDTIKEFTDPSKYCDGQILLNEEFNIWECK